MAWQEQYRTGSRTVNMLQEDLYVAWPNRTSLTVYGRELLMGILYLFRKGKASDMLNT